VQIHKTTNVPMQHVGRLNRLLEGQRVQLTKRKGVWGATRMRVTLEIGDIPTKVHEVKLLIGPGPICAVFMKEAQ